jgi:hypothetical protein
VRSRNLKCGGSVLRDTVSIDAPFRPEIAGLFCPPKMIDRQVHGLLHAALPEHNDFAAGCGQGGFAGQVHESGEATQPSNPWSAGGNAAKDGTFGDAAVRPRGGGA